VVRLEDAGETAGTANEAGREFLGEELLHGLLAAEPGHGQAAVRDGVLAAEGDEGLHELAELLGLHEGGLETLMLDDRDGETLHEGFALVGGAAKALAGDIVTHG